jgi:hypothetical protein
LKEKKNRPAYVSYVTLLLPEERAPPSARCREVLSMKPRAVC